MFRILMAGVIFVATACGGSVLGPEEIPGIYRTVWADGKLLPQPLYASGVGVAPIYITLHAATFELSPPDSAVLTLSLETPQWSGSPTLSQEKRYFRYVVEGQDLFIVYRGAVPPLPEEQRMTIRNGRFGWPVQLEVAPSTGWVRVMERLVFARQ